MEYSWNKQGYTRIGTPAASWNIPELVMEDSFAVRFSSNFLRELVHQTMFEYRKVSMFNWILYRYMIKNDNLEHHLQFPVYVHVEGYIFQGILWGSSGEYIVICKDT